MDLDTYRTILKPSKEVLYKDRNSKFFGYAFPVQNEEDIKIHIENLKKKHHAARHWCYAYQLGEEKKKFRVNDDGEPSNSAGMPIYGQIKSFDVTNILIVVVRYFGGTKLGVGGLINAYRNAAQMTLEQAKIVERTINKMYLISFQYKSMNKVMRIIKEKNLTIVNQKLELDCQVQISVRKNDAQLIFDQFKQLFEVDIQKL